jgi:hypothetical protein
MPRSTLHGWWDRFRAEQGVTLTMNKARQQERAAFFAWLETQRMHERTLDAPHD